MVIYDLICRKEHVFEGWFPSLEDFESQRTRKQLSCPVCGSKKVDKLPNACAIHTKKKPAEPSQTPAARPGTPVKAEMSPQEIKEALIRLHHHVQENFEDVGANFTKEAIRIQRGEAEQRPIHGTATVIDKEALDDAEVPYMILPKPELDS
jgi:hypothetical protein